MNGTDFPSTAFCLFLLTVDVVLFVRFKEDAADGTAAELVDSAAVGCSCWCDNGDSCERGTVDTEADNGCGPPASSTDRPKTRDASAVNEGGGNAAKKVPRRAGVWLRGKSRSGENERSVDDGGGPTVADCTGCNVGGIGGATTLTRAATGGGLGGAGTMPGGGGSGKLTRILLLMVAVASCSTLLSACMDFFHMLRIKS